VTTDARPGLGPDPIAPLRIHADREGRTLDIAWADGHTTRYDFERLRWLCPCAYCRGEAGLPGWLDSAPTLTAEQMRLVDIALVGQYAVAPTWGDGHHTGYYTFALLRDQCPCPADEVRRAALGRAAVTTAPAVPTDGSAGKPRHTHD
jgi:DUF971 family protein